MMMVVVTDEATAVFGFCNVSSSRLSQEAMRHLTGLLPEGLRQEVYGLWEVLHFGLYLMNHNLCLLILL